MHLRGLDLNLLVVLNTLLEEKNITRTGRRIYLSQSATSGALARLREFFDDELLVLVGHKMVLTPLAESLTLPVRDLLINAQAIIDQKPSFDPASSTREFRIMMSDYLAAVLMSKVAPLVEATAPAVQIRILPVAELPEERLERGEIDLLTMPEQFLSSAHPSRELFRDTYECVVWDGNDTVGDSLSLEEYFRAPHVGVRFGSQMTDSLEEWIFQQTNQVRQLVLSTQAYALIPQLLVGTKRIATMHRLMSQMYADYLPIRILKTPFEVPVVVERVQWHRLRDKDPGIAWLRKIIRSTAKEIARSSAPAGKATFASGQAEKTASVEIESGEMASV